MTDQPPPVKKKKVGMRVDDEEAGEAVPEPTPVKSDEDLPRKAAEPIAAAAAAAAPPPPPVKGGDESADEDDEDDEEDEEEDIDSESEKLTKAEQAVADSVASAAASADVSPAGSKEKQVSPVAKAKKKKAGSSKKQPSITYNVIADAGFKAKEPVPYLSLARAFVAIEGTSQRLVKTEHLANLLRSVVHLTPEDLLPTLYLIAGKVGPDFSGMELGVGESLLVKAIADATGQTAASVKAALRVQGDLGKVAAASKKQTRTICPPAPLTVRGVFASMREIAQSAGSQSRTKKQGLILRTLVSCRESEAQYIIRMLQGKFRIGCSEKTVLAALARALVQTPPGQDPGSPAEALVIDSSRKATAEEFAAKVAAAHAAIVGSLAEVPSYDEVVPVLLEPGGLAAVRERCKIRPGMPVHPMLAQPTKGVGEVLTRLESVGLTCEYKYDGERAQIHVIGSGAGRTVKIFSRNLEDNTGKYPDVIGAIKGAAAEPVESCIIDSEAVGWDPVQKKLLSFQVLSHRARKGVAIEDVKIRVCVFAFDILYLNGRSLLAEPLRRRRELLREHFHEVEGAFVFATFKNIAAGEGESAAIQPFLEEAVQHQCEGLMVKALDQQSEYVPNQRSFNWLKIKKDYMEGMTDTVDLVPIGAWFGTGKRTGWYGAYLLACYDEESESFQPVTKVATGLSDTDLEQHHAFFSKHAIPAPRPYYTIAASMKIPDVWLDAVQVWEVKGADLTISPAYTAAAGLVDSSRGVSLRFPRFLRVREDKHPEGATNSEQVAELYNKQTLCIASTGSRRRRHDE